MQCNLLFGFYFWQIKWLAKCELNFELMKNFIIIMISYDMNYVDVWTHIIISFYKIDERKSLVLTTLKSLILNTMFYSLANWPFVWLSVQIVLNLGVWCLMEFMLFNMKNIELNWAKIISVLLKFNFFFREEKFFMGLTSDSLFIFEWGLNHVQLKALCFVL